MWSGPVKVFALALAATMGAASFVGENLTVRPALGQELEKKQPGKIASVVEQMVYTCYEALAAGTTDVSGMSNTLLHVSPAGEIELRLNADRPIGADELEQLKGLGYLQ